MPWAFPGPEPPHPLQTSSYRLLLVDIVTKQVHRDVTYPIVVVDVWTRILRFVGTEEDVAWAESLGNLDI